MSLKPKQVNAHPSKYFAHLWKTLSLYGRAHAAAFKKSMQHFWLSPLSNSISLVTMSITLALPLLLQVTLSNFSQLSKTLDPGNTVTLYFDLAANEQQIENVMTHFKHNDSLQKVAHLTPAQVKEDYLHWQPNNSLLADLPVNPFPHVIVLQPQPHTSLELLKKLQGDAAQFAGVETTSVDYLWLERLHAWVSLGKTFFWALLALLSSGAVLIVSNTIRLTLSQHRQEIGLLFQLGATQAMIRRPFLYRGLLIGALAGLGSLMMVSLLTLFINPAINQVMYLYNNPTPFLGIQLINGVGASVLGGSLLGFLGALLAIKVEFKRLL